MFNRLPEKLRFISTDKTNVGGGYFTVIFSQ